MDPSIYRNRWQELRDGAGDAEALQELARQIAFSFVDGHFQDGAYGSDYIDLLCEMATSDAPAASGDIASAALFGIIVEKLCDDFEDLPVEVYCRVMSQVISYCRTVPAGRKLDARLAEFGLDSCDAIYRRAISVHTREPRGDRKKAPGRIVLLSRVTIGADVAILSVMIQRLRRLFPRTDMVVLGSRKLEDLFGGNPDVRIRELSYARRGGLFERFAAWHAALDVLREELADGEEDVLLIDPDSRISQLGVLPLTREENYLFFNTRDHMLSANGRGMAEWTNEWIDAAFGEADFAYPTIWVPQTVMTSGKGMIDTLRAAGARHIVAMNLGVGQNPRKRVDLEFEKRLLRALASTPDTVVVLDRGFGADEEERCSRLLADLREHGFTGAEASFASAECPSLSHGVVAVSCGIGEMAALIAHSDEYIGYDSACQHIAAAAGTPTLTVFAGSNNKNFVRRWSACGDTDCRIVHVNTLSDTEHLDADEVVARVMRERESRTATGSGPAVREIRMGRMSETTREVSKR